MEELIKKLDLQYVEGLSLSNKCKIYSFCNDVLISDFDFYNSKRTKDDHFFIFYRIDNVATWTEWPIELFLSYGKDGFKKYISEVMLRRIKRLIKNHNKMND